MSSEQEIPPETVDDLLSLATRERQAEFLRASGLFDAGGLNRLLDAADRLLNDDPGKARSLAELCMVLAEKTDAPAAVPRAMYVLAGAHDLSGEFDTELRLTRAAHDGYMALGMPLEALRTNVGKMGTLLDLGRYGDALDTGLIVLRVLDGTDASYARPVEREADLLAALVHQNRGICYEHMGRYDEALDAYASAEGRYKALGMTERLGEIIDNQGLILLQLGRGSEALEAHEAAADIFERSGLALSRAQSLTHIGLAHLQFGNYAASLDYFEQARRSLYSLDAPVDKHVLTVATADAYLALNLYPEALAAYREGEELLRTTGMVYERARGLWGMGSALAALAEPEEAEQALSEAAALFGRAGNAPLLSGVALEQASLRAASGETEGALAMARRAFELVSGEGRPVQQIYARLRLADLLPDMAEVESHLLEARHLAVPLGLPQLLYRLDERLGRLRLSQGRREEARELLEKAVQEIERLRGTVAQETMRASFLRDKTAAYEDLLTLQLMDSQDDGPRQAFVVAEQAKSRALVDLLTGVAGNGSAARADPELEGRIQGLQADLNATYSRMFRVGEDGRGASLEDLRLRATRLEAEIGRIRLRIAANSPDPFVATARPDGLLERLPPDVTLLAYHVVRDEILAFVVKGDDVRIVRHLGSVPGTQRLLQKLGVQWERFRADRGFVERHAATLERSARKVLGALYDELVRPLEPLLRTGSTASDGVPKLAVVPHGPLHQVPFHALFDGREYLLERFEVSYAPSAVVYALCQERNGPVRTSAAVFGVEDPLIPAALTEARAVARRIGPDAEVRAGEDATVGALRDEASKSGTLHLACHGLFRSDNPMFSALKLHDGWLTAADAAGLELSDALVTLSACESGRSEVIGGDEILGLTRAFLGAGAATLVVSLWLVQDETTAALMGEWYARLRDGGGRAAVLRDAQLELKDRHPHPYYWAPFVLVGKR